jgi:sec-independent protein translocase protein TatB
MFEVGFIEILLISILALVVLGPEKLPKVARQVGHWMGRARAMARQFREQLDEEAILDDAKPRPHKPTSTPNYSTTGSAASAAPATTPATAEPISAAPQTEEDESSYYPPDHHSHPNYTAEDAVAPAQSDWINPSDGTTKS